MLRTIVISLINSSIGRVVVVVLLLLLLLLALVVGGVLAVG